MKILYILGVLGLLASHSFAQKFDAKAGWNLFGATENITNMQVFDECAYLWIYEDDKFLTYGKGEGISSIDIEDGFWLYGTKDCPIDTELKVEPVATTEETVGASGSHAIFANSCSKCHGEFGGGTDLAKEIAGRTLTYLMTALNGYKDGSGGGEKKATMQEQVKDLSQEQLDSVALYISTLDSGTGLTGKALYSSSCSSCHGDSGQGGVGPSLSGKGFESIQEALHAYKDKTRSNTTMQAIVGGIKLEELNRIAKYISTL